MLTQHSRALLTIALMAAFADGQQDPRERDHIKRIGDTLSRDDGADFFTLYQDVLLQRVALEEVVRALDTLPLRQLAYETAVGVCDADGHHSAEEQAFLQRLAALLQMTPEHARTTLSAADALADSSPAGPLPDLPILTTELLDADESAINAAALGTPPAAATPTVATVDRPASPVQADSAELDKTILNAAILNGALELLPQSLASWAIIPLQTRLVYRIGKAHGYELDRRHITDFLATIGVGLTSQYVEQFGRKLVGGLLGKVLGKAGRAIGSQATGSAFSFASTWALGHVAKRYYAGGRTLDSQHLKQLFTELSTEARGLQTRYMPQIEARARTLDLQQLTAQLRN